MAIELSTAGIKVKWAVEATAGTRPTSGYTEIPEVTAIPDNNPEPNMLQTTPLSATKWHTYIPGLKDPSGAMGLTVNHCSEFVEAWEAMMTAYGTAAAAGKQLWIEYAIPTMDSFYYPAIPSELGFGGAEVDSVLQNTAYLTMCGEPVWAEASSAA